MIQNSNYRRKIWISR